MNVGLEFEFTGITRQQVAVAMSNYFGNCDKTTGLCDDITCKNELCERKYDIYNFQDKKGRIWSIGQDISIEAEQTSGNITTRTPLVESEIGFVYHAYLNELQTPVLDSENREDMVILRDILVVLNGIGCIVNDSCAFHLHIDAPKREKELGIFLHKYMQIQDEQYQLFGSEQKKDVFAKKYTIPIDCHTLHTLTDILEYIATNYPDSRYTDGSLDAKHFNINFAAVKEHNTIEFRAFNGTLNFVEVLERINYIKDFVNDCNYLKTHGWFDFDTTQEQLSNLNKKVNDLEYLLEIYKRRNI